MTTELTRAAELLNRWDAASVPNDLGLHNAGGFAQNNCVEIREVFRGLLAALATPPADDVREALAELVSGVVWSPGFGQRVADIIMADPRFEVSPRGTVTEPCEWCSRQHTGFAEWQGDGLAHPSCGREGCGLNFEPARGTVTDAEVEAAVEAFWKCDDPTGGPISMRAALEAARAVRS